MIMVRNVGNSYVINKLSHKYSHHNHQGEKWNVDSDAKIPAVPLQL